MKVDTMQLIEDGIAKIKAACPEVTTHEVLDSLTGFAWDEEERGQLEEFLIGTPQ